MRSSNDIYQAKPDICLYRYNYCLLASAATASTRRTLTLRGAGENVSCEKGAWEHGLLQDGGKAASPVSFTSRAASVALGVSITTVTLLVAPGFARMSTAAMATSVAYHLYNNLRKCHEGTGDCFLTTIKKVASMRRKLIITNKTDR
jgi:hypothetical protein